MIERPIVFVDIDGPLVTFAEIRKKRRPAMPDPLCVARLNRATMGTGAVLVISSAWRRGRTTEEFQKLFCSWGIEAQVIGLTPCNNSVASVPRSIEIGTWLIENTDLTAEFAVIDDEEDARILSSALTGGVDRLVLCDPMTGLSDLDSVRIRMLLKGEKSCQRQ